MTLTPATRAWLLAAPIVTLAVPPAPEARQTTPDAGFDVQQIAPGVHAVLRTDPPGLFPAANSVFIVNADDVVVVDTGGTPGAARALVGALTRITARPVSYVINTHWHDDHTLGNAVFREAFPKAQFVAHARIAAGEARAAAENDRKRLLQVMPVMTQQFRVAVEQKKNSDGLPLSDEERRSHLNDVAAWERFAAESQNVPPVAPAVTVTDKWTVTRGKRVIDVRYLGPGHTSEDLVVYLPQEQIAITGDLVTTPVPMLGAASHVAEYPATLAALAALKPSVLVPGHGGIRKGLDYVNLESRAFTELTGEVRTAVASGSTLPLMRKTLRTPDLEKAFAGDSQLVKFLFDFQFRSPGLSVAYREATQGKK
jgi:glyoxylase-like metal-dependent hydrolase (beta-lactamase superfamily II)